MQIINWLNKPKEPYGLGLFRILFGIILFWDLKRFHDIKIVESFYVHDIIFPYEFLKLPLPEQEVMSFIMGLLMICSILITLGLFYKIAMTLFAVGFSYFFFLDQVLYNNHLYLICILSFMMIFIPADAAFSLSKKRKKSTIPQWTYFLLQFQILIVYFFGAVSKFNPYWFSFHPVEEILNYSASRTENSFLTANWIKYAFTYGGFLFDLLIGPLLLFAKTRKMAIIGAILFNLINSYIFNDIFIFPFFMISTLILFVNQKKLYLFLERLKLVTLRNEESIQATLSKFGLVVVFFYVLVQVSLPLRHYFVEGYTDWTGEAQRFSWRMKIQNREIEQSDFRIFDIDQKVIHEVDPKDYLFEDEITQMCHSPEMVIQFSHYLKNVIAKKNNIANCWIKAKIKVAFNGLESQYIFNPDDDLLMESKKHTSFNDWIVPLSNSERYKSFNISDTTWK